MFDAAISNPNIHKLYIDVWDRPYSLKQYEYIFEQLKHNNTVRELRLFSDWLSVDETPDPDSVLNLILSMLEYNTTLTEFEIYYNPDSIHEETIMKIWKLLDRNKRYTRSIYLRE